MGFKDIRFWRGKCGKAESGCAGEDGDAFGVGQVELVLITQRVRLIYRSIVLAVLCALFICLVIAVAFIDAFVSANLARVLGALFVLAMVALIGALLMFLREIFLAVTGAGVKIEA